MRGLVVFVLIFFVVPIVSSQKFLGYWEIMSKEKEEQEEIEDRLRWVGFFEDSTYSAGLIGELDTGKRGVWTFDKKENLLQLISYNDNVDDGKYVIKRVSKDHMTLDLLWKSIYLEKVHKSSKVPIDAEPYWEYDFGSGYPNQNPAIDEANFYFGSDMTPVTCLDKNSGTVRWVSDVKVGSKGFFHSIAQDENFLYFNGTQGTIYKVDKNDGKATWSVKVPFDDDVLNKITVYNNLLFVNPLVKMFIALDKNGKEVWSTELSNPVFSYTIENSMIYANVGFGDFVVLDAKSGEILNQKHISSKVNFYPTPIVSKETLLLCDVGKETITGYNPLTLEEKWKDSTNQFKGMYQSGEMVFAISDSEFSRLSPVDGSLLWSVPGEFDRICNPTVSAGKVFIQTRYMFFIIDTKNGNVLLRTPFEHMSYTQPLITENGIYVGYEGMITKLKHPF